MVNRNWLLAAVVGPAVLASSNCFAQDEVAGFYKGKTLTIRVGYGTGGGFDTTTRLLARYYGSHVPGGPNVIVENMPGGGGMRVANYLYDAAPKDGSMLGVFSPDVALEPLLGNKNAKFSADKFSWIGSMTTDINSCGVWKGAGVGIKTLDDLLKSKKVVVFGSSGPQSNTSKYPLFMKNVLGAPIKVVTGYKGTKDVTLAMKRGEIDGLCGMQESSIKGAYWQDYQSGDLNVFVQLSMDRASDVFKGVPRLSDALKSKGSETMKIADIVFGPNDISRPIAAPPGVPAARVAALRKALVDTLADPKAVADGKKIGIEWNPMTGEEVSKQLQKFYQTPKEIVAKSVTATKE
ncbi:MAG: hypothetical protein RLZ98_1503 [Pseudomonadota bacterium]|jgi:tripartite-type tricarboxylate transporter receptor subunit TctC